MKSMRRAFSTACLNPQHTKTSSQTLYGIHTIHNEIYCSSSSEDYTYFSSEQSEMYHQRCSSGTSSVDTYTLKARMENLEIALTMLKENFKRMEHAMNKQIEKAIEVITAKTEDDETDEIWSGKKNKHFMKCENNRLTKAVTFLIESSKIMRKALSEHSGVIEHLSRVIDQPAEPVHSPHQKRNESPLEKRVNKCKKQKDKIQIVYPKAVNPSDISEYLAVKNSAKSCAVQPPRCICKTNNKHQTIWRGGLWEQEKSYINNNINDMESRIKCNCHICKLGSNTALDSNVDPDGEYVTLLRDYIGDDDEAYEYYKKPPVDVTSSNTDKCNSDVPMFDKSKGTLV